MSRDQFIRALLGATAFVAFASPASAQHVERIVAFGDSFADPGNALALAGIDPVDTIVYPTGRFSGGTNYVDTLATILGVPVDNFAVGGARTNLGNQQFGLPGFTAEVNFFLTGNTVGGVFPTTDGTFDENDLVTISIGGNDARAFQQEGGTVAGAAASAATAVGFAQAGIDQLVAAGAPTISFLAGDTSRLPEVNFYPDPAGARAVRSAYSTAFNQGIQDVLAGYAADGVIVHYLDLNAILDRIEADFGAYGFTGLACPPFTVNPVCVANSAATNNFVFYGDQLHLTSAGFAVVARYVAAQLDAPLTLQAPSDLGLDTARQFGRTLSTRLDLHGPRASAAAIGLRFFLVGDTFQRDVGESDDNNAFDMDGVGVTAGAEFALAGGVAGVAANYTRPRVRFGDDSSRGNGRSYQLGAYAGLGLGNLFGQAHLGVGSDRHRIRRTGVIDNMRARPDGSHVTAGAKAGYLMAFGPLRVGPVAALDYARARVDSYTEEGDAALTLDVGKQSLKTMTGQIGLEARSSLNAIVGAFRPFVSAMLEHDFTGDERTMTFAQTSAPGIVNSWQVDGEKQTYGRLSVGAAASILTGTSIDAAVTSTVGRDGGNELGAQIGVRMGF